MGETKSANANNNKNSDKFLSQVVIRHLPPTMTAEQFKNEISPVPDHNYFHFLKADLSLGQWAFTRACINFTKKDDIFVFKDKFDGYVFVDSNGTEYPAIVEFSPYQKVPRRRMNSKGEPLSCKKRDAKCGTIEEDSDYKSFIENLNDSGSQKNLPSAEVYLEEIEAREKELKANHGVIKVTTPLIEFIKQKKAEKLRLKEERREERRRQQMEQKRTREDNDKKDEKSNNLQFKVKQRDRKNKAKEGGITVAKNEKREREREKEKEKEKEKDKDKDKDKKKPKERADKEKPQSKLLEKDKERPPERGEKERERKRERNRRRDRENKNGDNDKNKPNVSNNERDLEKEGDKEVKKDKNVDKNRYFVVTYSGDKSVNGSRNQDSNRRSESMNKQVSQQQSSSSKMETQNDDYDESALKEIEGQSSANHQESNKNSKENKKSDNQRVRNKDRPALEIYRPRRARNQNNGSNGTPESSDRHDSDNKSERNIRKTKVFTRSRTTD